MSKASKLQAEINRLQAQLDGLAPIDAMGVRELARAANISPTTAMRAKRGEVLSKAAMEKLMPFLAVCPCCGQKVNQ